MKNQTIYKIQFVFILTIFFISCSNPTENNPQKEGETNEEIASDSTESNGDEKVSQSENTDEFIEEIDTDFDFDIIDNWLKLGIDQSIVIEKLGEPEKKGKDAEWGAIGTYIQQWRYDAIGLVLEMESNEENGNKHVFMITLNAPSKGKTSKMISIGAKAKDVEKAYKGKISEESIADKSIIVGSVYGGVIFILEKDIVTSIFIGAAAE